MERTSVKQSRYLRFALCALVSVLVLATSAVLAFSIRSAPAEVELLAFTSISVPESVPAGTIVSIEGMSDDQAGTAEVVVQNAYGRLSFLVPVASGSGRLDLPASVSQLAGVVSVRSGETSANFTITPLEVDEVVAPLVGPRTIVADAQDVSLAVILPVDRYQNQVANGTNVDVDWTQPSRQGEPAIENSAEITTDDGMVSVLLPSGEVAGPTTVRTTAATSAGRVINGASVRIDEVPGIVTDIALTAIDKNGVADGRSPVEIETGVLSDQFGNELFDGTVGQFIFDGPSGQGVVSGTVQNGVIRVEIVSPNRPGILAGQLEVQGQVSNEITIEFASAIDSFTAQLDQVGNDAVLRVGPAIDAEGAFVADGTPVRWGDHRTQIRSGVAEIRIPAALVPQTIPLVEILGLERIPTGALS